MDTIADPNSTGRIIFDGVSESGLTFRDVNGDLVISDGLNAVTFQGYYSGNYTYDFVYENAPPPPSGTFSIAPQSVTIDESAGTVEFTVTRSDGASAQTVYASTVQNQGSANDGDYAGKLNEPVVFAAGELTKTVAVQITDDTVVGEGNETFGLIVQRSPTDPQTDPLASASFTIQDNNVAPPPSATYSIAPTSGDTQAEGNSGSTPFLFTVTRTGSLVGNAMLEWAVSANSSPAADGQDFAGGTLPSEL